MSNKPIYGFVLFLCVNANRTYAMDQKVEEAKRVERTQLDAIESEKRAFELEQQRKIAEFYKAKDCSIDSRYQQYRLAKDARYKAELKEFEDQQKSWDEAEMDALMARVSQIEKAYIEEADVYEARKKEFFAQLERDKAEFDLRIKMRLEELKKVALEKGRERQT